MISFKQMAAEEFNLNCLLANKKERCLLTGLDLMSDQRFVSHNYPNRLASGSMILYRLSMDPLSFSMSIFWMLSSVP